MSKKDDYKLTEQDAAEILASTLQVLREAGIPVGIRNAPAKNERPAGIMIFAANIEVNESGLTFVGAQKEEIS